MARIFWDTNLFIYLFEDNPTFAKRVTQLRGHMLSRGDQLYTSALTVGEILVKPIAAKRNDLETAYLSFFKRTGITVIPFDLSAATAYARIRKDRGVRAPDAIQLACAAAANIDLFITNDERLSKNHVTGINFITSLDRAPIV